MYLAGSSGRWQAGMRRRQAEKRPLTEHEIQLSAQQARHAMLEDRQRCLPSFIFLRSAEQFPLFAHRRTQ